MARAQTILVRVLVGFLMMVVIPLGVGLLLVTRTDWGRERVRAFAVGQLANSVNGRVSVERLSGTLLSGATLENVVIEDSSGAPFLHADTIQMRYSLRSFLSRQLIFRDLRLVRPVVILEQAQNGQWNFARLFPQDTTAQTTDTTAAFSNVRLENLQVVDGTVVVRAVWSPVDSLVADALAGRTRMWVVQVPGGYQQLSIVSGLDAELPLVRLVDPDSAARVLDIERASMIAFPFRPPAASIRDLRGRIGQAGDSIFFDGVHVALPGTQLSAQGVYVLETGALRAALGAQPIAFEDLRWIRPSLPAGGGRLEARVARAGRSMHIIADEMDLTIDSGRVAGVFDVQLGDTLRIGEANVTLSGIDTRLIEQLAERVNVPVNGVADGTLILAGTPELLEVDGWVEFRERTGAVSRVVADGAIGAAADGGLRADALRIQFDPVRTSLVRQVMPDLPLGGSVIGTTTMSGTSRAGFDISADVVHNDPRAGRSRVRADGGVALQNGPVARDLRVRFDPVPVAVLESFVSDLPVGGSLAGNAVLNGSPATRLATRLDVTHTDSTGNSRLTGTVAYANGGNAPRVDADLRVPVVSMRTVGRFVPAAGLQGTASGGFRASGTTRNLGFTFDLVAPEGGTVVAEGTLDSRARALRYDVRARLTSFDASVLSERSPETGLNGSIAVRGQGTDLATLNATVDADLIDSGMRGVTADTSRLRANLASGFMHIERGHFSLASAVADVEGSFGIAAGQSADLRYRVVVADLRDFARYIPGDTTVIVTRPLAQTRQAAMVQETAREAEVRRVALGETPPQEIEVDSLTPLRADSVAGRIEAAGTVTGGIDRFDVRGTATADHVVASGTTLASGRARYVLVDFGTPDADLTLEAGLDSLRAAGFAFDSASASVNYRGVRGRGRGTLNLGIFQDRIRDYRIASDVLVALDRREMTFTELMLRFDTIQWTAPHSGRLSWAGDGVSIDSLELRSNRGDGRIHVHGRVPDAGESDLRVRLERLPVEQIAGLLQDTSTAIGLLNLDARLRGTRAAPRFQGSTSVVSASLEGRPLPDLQASFAYADRQLQTDAELRRAALPLMTAHAELPINLAISGVTGPRLLDSPMDIRVHADSLPLETLASFTEAVADVSGVVRADVTVAGTFDSPQLSGGIDLDIATMRVVPAGLALRDIIGTARMEGSTVTVDSIAVISGGGPIRMAGSIEVESLARPTFDLVLESDGAIVLDNERGRIRGDAQLTITGPLDSARIAGNAVVREGVIHAPDVGTKKRVTRLDDPTARAALDTTAIDADVIPRVNRPMQNLQLDIGLRVGRNTWVRNSDGNVEVYTPDGEDPLRVRMNIDEPGLALDGVINADRGEYTFAGRVFEMTTGSITFVPGNRVDPLLRLNALYEVPRRGREALVIQIHVTGSLMQPRIALESSSQPPLSESDILSYLAFGQSSSSVLSLNEAGLSGGTDGAGGISALAQQQLATLAVGAAVDQAFSGLERKGAGAGLDVLRIHPADLPSELAFSGDFGNFLRGTEVIAGKYLSPRLFIAAEGRTTTEAWPGFRIEYDAPTGFSWVMTWEPRFLPVEPSLASDQNARSARVFGTFFYWSRRF